jgi:hypothetical protein
MGQPSGAVTVMTEHSTPVMVIAAGRGERQRSGGLFDATG